MCYTAACNGLPVGRHMLNCPVSLNQRQSTSIPSLAGVPGTPSATTNLWVTPSFITDVLADARSDPRRRGERRHGERRQEQRVPWFQRHSSQSVTLDSLDTVQQHSGFRQVDLGETALPRWNPPDRRMDESDNLAWRRHFTERLLGEAQTDESDDEPQVTTMDEIEHLASLSGQGSAIRTDSQQSRATLSFSNNIFQLLHNLPRETRQAVQRADTIAESMDFRQTFRRAGRNHNRGRGWSVVRLGSDQATLR